MKTLFINGSVINVFTDTIEKTNVLVEDEEIIGIGDYSPNDADVTVDTTGTSVRALSTVTSISKALRWFPAASPKRYCPTAQPP